MIKLFQAGALDVYFTPIFLKKNRPATKLSVIAHKEDELSICDLILRETSTLGVRVKPCWRHEGERQMVSVMTCYGEVPVKLKIMGGEIIQATPEFDVCVKLAEYNHKPVIRIVNEAQMQAKALLNNTNKIQGDGLSTKIGI